jgi:signal transduction histidine kinase
MHSLVALLVLAIGLGATFYYWQNLRKNVETETSTAFNRQMQMIADAMQARINLYETFLRGSAGLVAIDGGGVLNQADWEAYHQPYNITRNFPAIEGIGVSRYLKAGEVSEYLERRYEQGDNFKIFPAGERKVYAPITFDARFTGNNGKSLGYDSYSDPSRRQAMERSVETNKLTMSGKVNLVSEARQGRTSFILYLPVYKNGQPTGTAAERWNSLLGFVHIAVDTETFIDMALADGRDSHVAMQMYDAEGSEKGKKAYESQDFNETRNSHGAILKTTTVDLYDHRWRITFAASPEILPARDRQLPEQALWRGLVTCVFFAGLVWYLITDRERKYARQKKEEVQTAKDDLLSLASHQLRTPATVVKQYVGMLLQGYAGNLTQQQLTMLGSAYNSNERQLEIINQLLYVARLDAGRITLHYKKTDLTKLMRDVARDHSETIANRKQQLTFHLPKRPLSADVDPHYMRMVLENLLSNAVKYTPEKGAIVLEMKRAPGEIVVVVKDNGVGIDPAAQAQIFDKFTRAENELSNDVNGSGVGLYLTKQIVELHGGTIQVQSQPGEGSSFAVRIPTERSKPEVQAP